MNLVKLLVWDCCYFHVLLVVLCNSSLFVRCLCVVPCLLACLLSLSLWSTYFPFLLFLPSSHSSAPLVFFHPHTCAADPQSEGGGREEAKEKEEGSVEGEEVEVEEKGEGGEEQEEREGGEEKKKKKEEKVVKQKKKKKNNNNNNKRRW